jgi:dephospho-CoA kinase
MDVIGVTGGMGSGKTTVCKALESLGYAVYDADENAKRLMSESESLRAAILAAFGPEAYTHDGALNRAFLAKRVFSDDHALKTLNALVHPAVQNHFARWLQDQSPVRKFVFKEAAIMFEAGTNVGCKAVVYVAAPEPVRIQRAMTRDRIPENEVRKRLSKQWPDEKKIPLADYVVVNDGNNPLIPQIYVLLQWLNYEVCP